MPRNTLQPSDPARVRAQLTQMVQEMFDKIREHCAICCPGYQIKQVSVDFEDGPAYTIPAPRIVAEPLTPCQEDCLTIISESEAPMTIEEVQAEAERRAGKGEMELHGGQTIRKALPYLRSVGRLINIRPHGYTLP